MEKSEHPFLVVLQTIMLFWALVCFFAAEYLQASGILMMSGLTFSP